MEIYEAISKMKTMSDNGESFSISFMSYSYDKRKSDGIVEINNVKLRGQSSKENNRFADIMLNMTNLDTMEYFQCWQPLLLELNGEELELR